MNNKLIQKELVEEKIKVEWLITETVLGDLPYDLVILNQNVNTVSKEDLDLLLKVDNRYDSIEEKAIQLLTSISNMKDGWVCHTLEVDLSQSENYIRIDLINGTDTYGAWDVILDMNLNCLECKRTQL